MKFGEYVTSLNRLSDYMKSYLDPRSQGILKEKATTLISSPRSRDKIKWRIAIPTEHPLTFKMSSERSFHLQVDLVLEMEGEVDSSDSIIISKYRVSIRTWSLKESISYRPGIDAKELEEPLKNKDWKRVVLRFHMDKRSHDTENPEPLYHLHFGGVSKWDEYCWIPKQIDEPRFYYFPMDLVLLCEFILVNFFPSESKDLRKEPEWTRLVQKSQKMYLEPYIDNFKKFLNNDKDTLLGHLTRCK